MKKQEGRNTGQGEKEERPYRSKFAEPAFDEQILGTIGKMVKSGEIPIEKVPLPTKKKS